MGGDRLVVARREHHRGERADAFDDAVAVRRLHRPGGVGERLAAVLLDQLQGQPRRLLIDGRLGQLAGVDLDVGADHGIGVAVVADDVVGAGGQADHLAGGGVADQQETLVRTAFVRRVDIEADVARLQWHVLAVHRQQSHAAGVEHEDRAAGRVVDGDLADKTGASEAGVDVVDARVEPYVDDAAAGLAEQGQLAVRARLVAEDAPFDAVGQGLSVKRQPCLEGEGAGPDVPWRAGVRGFRRGLLDDVARNVGVQAVAIGAVARVAEFVATGIGRLGRRSIGCRAQGGLRRGLRAACPPPQATRGMPRPAPTGRMRPPVSFSARRCRCLPSSRNSPARTKFAGSVAISRPRMRFADCFRRGFGQGLVSFLPPHPQEIHARRPRTAEDPQVDFRRLPRRARPKPGRDRGNRYRRHPRAGSRQADAVAVRSVRRRGPPAGRRGAGGAVRPQEPGRRPQADRRGAQTARPGATGRGGGQQGGAASQDFPNGNRCCRPAMPP